MKVAIVDYGMGNLGSVRRALSVLNAEIEITKDPEQLSSVDRIILPGVGSFCDGMANLTRYGWDVALKDAVQVRSKPLLGICLGMQLLATRGSEGNTHGTQGLNLIPGAVEHLTSLGCKQRIPHVGWNSINLSRNSSIFSGISCNTDFYFVHSFAFIPANPCDSLATVDYDLPIVAAIQSGSAIGTQFHPEKSSKAGIKLLKNFLEFAPC